MMAILIANRDLNALDSHGAVVRVNGQPTTIRRIGGHLVYADSDGLNRCQILAEFPTVDDAGVAGRQFFCASAGQDPADCVVVVADDRHDSKGGG